MQDVTIYSDIFSQFYKVLKKNGTCVLHLGVIPDMDVGKIISPLAKKTGFKVIDLIYENIEDMEKHGIKEQWINRSHEFLILKKS